MNIPPSFLIHSSVDGHLPHPPDANFLAIMNNDYELSCTHLFVDIHFHLSWVKN